MDDVWAMTYFGKSPLGAADLADDPDGDLVMSLKSDGVVVLPVELLNGWPHIVPMPTMQAPRLTVEDYRCLPEIGPRYQLIEGDLYMAPAPNRYHQDISRNLELILGNYLKSNPIGKLYDAPFDVVLDPHDVFQPDILFVSNQRSSILTEAGAEGAPDFIAEILSPKTARLDLDAKRKTYLRHGVRELWIIDPDQRTILIYRPEIDAQNPVATHREGDVIECPMFPGLRIDTVEVFAR
jgi:Uma2 family endonuclease